VTSAATLDKPLGILVADTAAESAAVSQVRIQVQLEAGAAASFVEAHVSRGDGRHFCNAVLEFELARDSEIDYLRIQQRARQHIQIGKLAVRLAERAKFRHGSFDLGGSLIRNDIVAELLGSDSRIELYGLYLAGNQQHVDNHTSVYHRVGPSTSREEYRGILNRRARCVFNGKAVVDRGADGADAQQANHNLLLSDDAEIDTKPELEIYADDVKCSHGATVGQLDRTAMFYLRSRGLDEASATQLLMRAFAAEVIGMMTVAQATGYLSQIVDRRLDELTRDANDG
jgi:Fe-S cluster assembly protein SufD